MRIHSITINDFGKLKNFNLSFSDGFQVLYGENEQGKSTIMAFIRMMLYGSGSREKDLSKNIRKRYMPWDGSKMSGSMEFVHEGTRYRLEKMFGATPKNDIVKLWNQSTNEMEQLTEQKEIGRRFFGLGEDAFEKSVFIGQIGSVINTEKDKENEIIQKLQNLASSGDETQSFNLIESRLQSAAERIKSKGGRIGILDRLKQTGIALEDDKAEAIAMEAENEKMQKAYLELQDKKDLEEKNLEEQSNLLEKIRQYKKYCELHRIVIKAQEVNELKQALHEAKEPLVHGDFQVDPAFIDESRVRLQAIVHLQTILQGKNDEILRRKTAIRDSSTTEGLDIGIEEFERTNDLYKKILSDQEQMAVLQSTITKDQFAIREANLFENALQENMNKMEDYQSRITQIKMVPLLPSPDSKNIHFPVAGCVGSGILLAVLLLAGYMIHPFIYCGAAVPGILLLVLWIHYSKQNHQIQEEKRIASEEIREKNSRRQADISFWQEQWDDLFAKQKQMRQERAEDMTVDQRSFAEIQTSTEYKKASYEKMKLNREKSDAKMKEIFLHHQVSSFEELQAMFYETQNRISRKNEAIKELEERMAQFNTQWQELKAELLAVTVHFDRIKKSGDSAYERSVVSIKDRLEEQDAVENSEAGILAFLSGAKDMTDAARNMLEMLTQQYHIALNRQSLLDAKEKDLDATLGLRPLEFIRQEFESVKARYENGELETLVEEPSEQEIAALQKNVETLTGEWNSITIALAQKKSEMIQTFLDRPELSMIEEKRILNEQTQRFYQTRHEELIMAKMQMEQAFFEMQQTFGPIVNKKTAEIFSRITNGRYQELLVSKDLTISFREPLMDTTQEWQYLSGGTIDQVYFSLRLAISGFLADQTGGLPLFIDDAFLQYDDSRTKQSLLFLEDYSKIQQAQILFFTCHRSLYDQCGANTNRIDLLSVVNSQSKFHSDPKEGFSMRNV